MFRSKQSASDEPVITSSLDSGKASIVRRQTDSSPVSSPSSPRSLAKGGDDYFSMAANSSGSVNGTPNRAVQRENSQSSFVSGKASIRMSSDAVTSQINLSEEAFEVVDLQADSAGHAQYNYNKTLPEAPVESTQDVTVESMTAVLAAAVQMSTNPTKNLSSLSLGHASIVPSTPPPADAKPSPGITVRTSRLFSFSGKRSESSPALSESVSTPTSASSGASPDSSGATTPSRFTLFSRRSGNTVPTTATKENKDNENNDENGMKELEYRGITVKEIKGTLKTMVIPDNVKNPMPESKIQRPGFARVIY